MQKSIFLIEDDQNIRHTFKRALEREGYGVVTAENGRDALEQLRHTYVPNLIILDLVMPKMDGYSFLEAFCNDSEMHQVPVIAVSASSDGIPVPYVRDILKKPLDLQTLLDTAKKHCV